MNCKWLGVKTGCLPPVVLVKRQAVNVPMSRIVAQQLHMLQECEVAGAQRQSGQGRAPHRQAAAFLQRVTQLKYQTAAQHFVDIRAVQQ